MLTVRSTWLWECNDIANYAIVRHVRNARQSLLVPVQVSACRVVDAVVPRPVHLVDLLADVEQVTILGVGQPELPLRVVASTAVGFRRWKKTSTHETGTRNGAIGFMGNCYIAWTRQSSA